MTGILAWADRQGRGGDAAVGVRRTGFGGPGSGSGVFLIHEGENSGGRPRGVEELPAGVSQLRNGYYHAGCVNVL